MTQPFPSPDPRTRVTPSYELTKKELKEHRKHLRDMYTAQVREERRTNGSGGMLWVLGIILCVSAIAIAVAAAILSQPPA